jgi:PAS domain S-box-containing protein
MPFDPPLSRSHRSTVALVLLAGLALSFLTWHYARKQEARQIHAAFLRRAQTQATVTREHLNTYEEMVYSLRGAFVGQESVTRSEFARVAQGLLERHAGVQGLEWVRIVPRAERAAFEKQASTELGRPFVIQRRDSTGALHPAAEDEEYTVVTYAEPLAGNEAALGFDVTTAPTAQTVASARAERKFKVSPSFQLLQSQPQINEPGVVFILPVSLADAPGNPVVGFAEGVFHVQTMLAQSHQLTTNDALDTYYLDLDSGQPAPVLLYANLAGVEPMRQPGVAVAPPALHAPEDFQDTLTIGDRHWLMVIQQNPSWAAGLKTNEPLLILAAGVTITFLLALFINSLLQRTDRVEREVRLRTAQLRESEARLQAIIDHNPNAIFAKDLEGRYVLVNRQHERNWQKSAASMIGRNDEQLFPPDLAAGFRSADRRVLESGDVLKYEFTVNLPPQAGPTSHIVQKFPLRDAAGKIYGIGCVSTDITDRKQVEADKLAFERNLLETQKLESLGVLAGGIAHDFNNILTAVLSNASLARLAMGKTGPGEGYLQQIEHAARRAADLCAQMLAYAGKGKLSTGPLDLSHLVRDTTSLLEVAISKNCLLTLHLADPMPPVLADATQLRQIVMNLVINSSDAIGERPDGKITVTTFTRQADAALFRTALHQPKLAAGLYAGLEVRDNGSGMSPETIERIFEPFFTTKFSGRGLGLSAVLGIVQSHHGALFVESRPGEGSTFRLLLPVAAVAPEPKSVAKSVAAKPDLHGTVLVVDDEEAVRFVMGEVIRMHGATALLAADGAQALEICQQQGDKIDLILLDLTMPGLSGEDVMRQLQQRNIHKKVVVMSGYSEEETMRRCAELGVAAFLRKPFELDAVVAKLQTLLV